MHTPIITGTRTAPARATTATIINPFRMVANA
jgi:hypothetical protein